MIKPDVTRFW